MKTGARQNDNLALARQVFEWFKEGEMQALYDALHPDVQAHPSIAGGPVLDGREAVADWFDAFAAGRGELEARPLDYEVSGNCVIVRGYLRHRDGRTLSESQVYWLYEIRDGQIARMESHPSRNAALSAC